LLRAASDRSGHTVAGLKFLKRPVSSSAEHFQFVGRADESFEKLSLRAGSAVWPMISSVSS